QIVATDVSAPALEVARRNAARHGVDPRIELLCCNLLDGLHNSRITNRESRPFDLIVSNPPYIATRNAATLQREVREHEPRSALFAGDTGAALYAPLIAQAEKLLKPGSFLVLEVGCDLAEQVGDLLKLPEWAETAITFDLANLPRVVSARRTAI